MNSENIMLCRGSHALHLISLATFRSDPHLVWYKGKDWTEVQLVAGGPVSYAPAVDVLNRRGEISSTPGLMPAPRSWAKYLSGPFFPKRIYAVVNLNGIAVAAVASRLDATEKAVADSRKDLLSRILTGQDDNGHKMGRIELTVEALTQFIAGSDTISNTACGLFCWILHGERAAPGTINSWLQAELGQAIPDSISVTAYAMVNHLPFLKRCIVEGMRLHSKSAISLPRIVVEEPGVDFDDLNSHQLRQHQSCVW